MSMVDIIRTANGINTFPFRLYMYHRLSLRPVCVDKMSCPFGPSNLTV